MMSFLRAHGRNWKKWWHHDHKDERYDYLYKPDEIRTFGETLKAVSTIVPKAYAYLNNHADAQSVANAIQLKEFLGQPLPKNLHAEMLQRYPSLTADTRTESDQRPTGIPVRKR